MNNLSLEQCKQLKEWGLPQGKSDRVWTVEYGAPTIGRNLRRATMKKNNDRPDDVYDIPDLEQLLEFAVKECRKGFFVFSLDDRSAGGWSADGGWKENGETTRVTDPDPKQAVYKLLEKVMDK